MIYFDNGATSYPKPGKVIRAVNEAFTRYGANPGRSGHTMAMCTDKKVFECREAAAKLFHIDAPEQVVFCCNATHAINAALKGSLYPGDHVIISDLEHNAVLRPIHTMMTRGDISYSIACVDSDSDDETVDSFRRLIRPETRMIACTHGSNVFGLRLPIERIGALAAEHGLLFVVDAAQTAGVVDIDMRACNIDFLCTAGHKGLYGPSGTGLLLTPHGCEMNTMMEGGTGSFSSDFNQPKTMPDRLESGTVNTSGIIGLCAGIGFVMENGPDRLYRHEMKIAGEIHRGLGKIKGVRLYNKECAYGRQLPVVSFNLAGLHSEEMGQKLSDAGIAVRAGLHCAPLAHQKMGTLESGTVRVSVGAFNTADHATQLCGAVKKIAAKHCNTPGIW